MATPSPILWNARLMRTAWGGGDAIHACTIASGVDSSPSPQPIVSPSVGPREPAARARVERVEPSGETWSKKRSRTIDVEKLRAARARRRSCDRAPRPAPARCSLTRPSIAWVYAFLDTPLGCACPSAHASASATGAASSATAARHSTARPLLITDTTPFFVPAGLAVGLARKGRATPAEMPAIRPWPGWPLGPPPPTGKGRWKFGWSQRRAALYPGRATCNETHAIGAAIASSLRRNSRLGPAAG